MPDKNEKYKYKLYRRLLAGLAIVILGLIVSVRRVPYEAKALYSGVSGGIMGGGFLLIFRSWRLLRNQEQFRENRVVEADERIQNIQNEAFRLAGIAMACVCVIELILLAPANPEAGWALLAALFVFGLVHLAAYTWLSKKR